ncbi:MAG: hypothetical protein K0R00_795 [Herbinix sp.]|jgi:hypothetical protein|nr:hypothetical protein [Herbinix sp.]
MRKGLWQQPLDLLVISEKLEPHAAESIVSSRLNVQVIYTEME